MPNGPTKKPISMLSLKLPKGLGLHIDWVDPLDDEKGPVLDTDVPMTFDIDDETHSGEGRGNQSTCRGMGGKNAIC